MLRPITIVVSLIWLGILILGGAVGSVRAETTWTCPEGFEGQSLRIFNYSTYVAEDTVSNFEKLCGVDVEYFEFGSAEEMYAIVHVGVSQYDVIIATDYIVPVMIDENLVQPLNYDLIPNAGNIREFFHGMAYDPDATYTLPYQWGTMGIGFDKNYIDPEDMTSWYDFFEYDGRVAWIDDQQGMLGIGLLLQGNDPNSADEGEVMAAADFLLDTNRADVYEVAPNTGQDLLLRGEVDAVVEYNGDIFQIMTDCECDDFVYVIPEEGTFLWVDSMVIPANAANPELAHAYIDYILDPQVGADLSNFTTYATPNEAALEFIDPDLLNNPAIYPDEETLSRTFSTRDKGSATQFYAEAWNRINATLNR